MRIRTLTTSAVTVALLAASASFGAANAAPGRGHGTSATSDTVLRVLAGDKGQFLDVTLLGDEAFSNTDAAKGTPQAYSRIRPLVIKSAVNTASDKVNGAAPEKESRQPGGEPSVTTAAVDLGDVVPGGNLPVSLLSGGITPATLTSALDQLGARAAITSAVRNVGAIGGLISVPSIDNTVNASTAGDAATTERSVKVGDVKVLDLSSLLAGLGIPLGNLPLDAVSGLVGALKLPVAGLPANTALSAYVAQLTSTINELQATVAAGTETLTEPLTPPVTGVLSNLPVGRQLTAAAVYVPQVGDPISTVNTALDSVKTTLGAILNNALKALDNAALLSVRGIDVGVVTKAASTLEASKAEVVGTVGDVVVGGVTIPGVNLAQGLGAVNALAGKATDTIKGVLSTINPALGDLVDVRLFEKVANVDVADGYTRSEAGITALAATVKVPAQLAAILNALPATGGIANTIETLTGTAATIVPDAVAPLASTVFAALPAAARPAGLLAGGATVRVAEVKGASTFTAPAAPTGTLPRTGASGLMLAALASLLIALGLGFRTWFRSPVRA